MKKKLKICFITILVLAVCVCAWLIGYHTRKSQDNLPSLESVAEMDEAELNELLVGYRNYQLTDVWEEPDEKHGKTWIWEIDEHTQLQVSANNKDKIVICGLDSVFQAEILEICEGSYLVEPLEGSPELRSADRITISIEHLDSSLEPEIGDIIEIVHSGEIMESDPARLQDVYRIRVIEEEQWDMIPMVMVDGKLYLTTGMESSVEARCGVMDGEITSTVDGTEKPTKDNESNFGTGYGYQYGPREGTIEIFMNEKWWIFATEEVRQEIQFPEEPTVVKVYDTTNSEDAFENDEPVILIKHYEMSDGTWKTDTHTYKYKLVISGRMHNAAKDSHFIFLSNLEEITFHQAWNASGLSSNMDDYFDEEEAKFVGWE